LPIVLPNISVYILVLPNASKSAGGVSAGGVSAGGVSAGGGVVVAGGGVVVAGGGVVVAGGGVLPKFDKFGIKLLLLKLDKSIPATFTFPKLGGGVVVAGGGVVVVGAFTVTGGFVTVGG
jgi:S-DNA-T family DNA segregation ATPase FtsK/SpoIIIE